MSSWESVLKEAAASTNSSSLCNPYEDAYIENGIKIVRDKATGEVVLYNTRAAGSYYIELNEAHRELILASGWEVGTTLVVMSLLKSSIAQLKAKLENDELNEEQVNKIETQIQNISERWQQTSTKLSLISA